MQRSGRAGQFQGEKRSGKLNLLIAAYSWVPFSTAHCTHTRLVRPKMHSVYTHALQTVVEYVATRKQRGELKTGGVWGRAIESHTGGVLSPGASEQDRHWFRCAQAHTLQLCRARVWLVSSKQQQPASTRQQQHTTTHTSRVLLRCLAQLPSSLGYLSPISSHQLVNRTWVASYLSSPNPLTPLTYQVVTSKLGYWVIGTFFQAFLDFHWSTLRTACLVRLRRQSTIPHCTSIYRKTPWHSFESVLPSSQVRICFWLNGMSQ